MGGAGGRRSAAAVLCLASLWLGSACTGHAQTSDLERQLGMFKGTHGLRVSFEPPLLEGVTGTPIAPDARARTLMEIAAWSSDYPAGFLGRYVSDVVVLDDLVVDGIRAGGHRAGRQLLLCHRGTRGQVLNKGDFDHEVFHALDGGFEELARTPDNASEHARALMLRNRWQQYRVTASDRYTFSWDASAGRTPWIGYVPVLNLVWLATRGNRTGDEPPGFANRWGTVAPREDRATVAERLMAGDERFLRRAASDAELREKVAIIKAMYRVASNGAMDDSFWTAIAGGPSDVPSLIALASEGSAAAGPVSAAPEPVSVAAAREPIVAIAEPAPDPVPPRPPPARVPPAPTPAPAPAATPSPKLLVLEQPESAPTTPAEAYGLGLAAFHARDWPTAFARWRTMLQLADPNQATIQLSINCKIENAVKNQRELEGRTSFYMLPIRFQDAVCQVSLTGLYRSRSDAERAISGLPDSIRALHPRALLVSEVLIEVRE